MSKGINKVIIIGNVGQDPETKYSAHGNAICNLSVATTESWKDKQSGQRQDKTEWHKIVMFNKLAEITSQYVKKGSKIYLEGKLQTRKWQDQNGQDRYSTEIIASEMQMLDGKNAEPQHQAPSNNFQNQAPAQQAPPQYHATNSQPQSIPAQQAQYAPQQSAPQPAQRHPQITPGEFEDNIPFN